jgi:hypothetical protein
MCMITIRTKACLTLLLTFWHDGSTYPSRVSFLCNRPTDLVREQCCPCPTGLWSQGCGCLPILIRGYICASTGRLDMISTSRCMNHLHQAQPCQITSESYLLLGTRSGVDPSHTHAATTNQNPTQVVAPSGTQTYLFELPQLLQSPSNGVKRFGPFAMCI